MRVDVERVHALKEELAVINRTPLEEIEVYEDGKRVDIPQDVIDDWKFIGLNNSDFVNMEFWKGAEEGRGEE